MYGSFAAEHLHLQRQELYRMNPGLFYDLVQIWKKNHGGPQEPAAWAE